MVKKISLIVGSPRKNRSCNFLIDNAIEGIKEISDEFEINKIQISEYKITPCNGCDACLKAPNDCPLSENDDMKKLEEKILGSSALLISASNYFGTICSQVKVFIDRSRPWKMKNYLMKDIIFGPMAASGLRNSGESVIVNLINFALIQGMIVVGNVEGVPFLEGNIPITTLQKQGLKDFVGKGEIDELGALIARDLGKRVAELVLKMS